MSSAIFQQVVEATRGEYVLHGTLGHSDALGSAFLASEVVGGRSVVLVVPPNAESLDVVGALSDAIPADGGGCAACGFRIGTWVDACPRCEHVLVPSPGPSPDASVLREQLRDSFDVIGSLPHVRGGTMYFARDLPNARLTTFVLRPQPDGQLGLDVVWEAVPEASAALAASEAPSYGAFDGEAFDGRATSSLGGGTEHEYVAPDGPRPIEVTPEAVPPARQRAWLPIGAGVGILALVAVAAFALTHHDAPRPLAPLPADTALTLNTPPVGVVPNTTPGVTSSGASTSSLGGTSVLPGVNDSARRAAVAAAAARRRYRDSVRLANAAAVLTIDSDSLPKGWTVSVNGSSPTTTRDVSVPPGAPAVVRIEAPGYCADELPITLAPGSHQHWAPILRGRPITGAC